LTIGADALILHRELARATRLPNPLSNPQGVVVNKLIVSAATFLFAVFAATASAGVAPNSTSSAASQSGAKIAPAKPAAEEKKEHEEQAREPSR
jgi:hypothetical protein